MEAVRPVVPPVGRSLPRVDGVAKVTGRAQYLDDLDAAGAWHGATVRSAVAHGVLEAIEIDPSLDPALDAAELCVVTAADIPGKNAIALIEDDQPALVPIGGGGRPPTGPTARGPGPPRPPGSPP